MTDESISDRTASPIETAALYIELEQAIEAANNENYAEAIEICHEAIKSNPAAAEPYFLLGVIAFICGDEGQAISMCETAHRSDPNTAEYAKALATIYTRVGQLADGLYFAKLFPSLEPHPLFSARMPPRLRDLEGAFAAASPSTHSIEAQRLFNIADFERALLECTAEIRLNPNSYRVYVLMGRTAIILKRFNQAVGALQAAVQIDPDDGMAPALLARALVGLGRFDEAVAAAKRAIELAGDDAEIFVQAMNALQLCPLFPLSDLQSLASDFTDAFNEENMVAAPDPFEGDEKSPTRIGVLSNRFFRTAGHDLFANWFSIPKRPETQYLGYQQSVHTDVMTTTIKNRCESWREIYNLDPFTLSVTLQGEELDVLVDVSGPDGETRLTTSAMQPCRVRVGAFAAPEPGLLPGVSHVLSDEFLEPGDRAALLADQQCVTISGTLFSQPPFTGLAQNTSLPAREKGFVTFGGMLDLTLLTPECATLWAKVLHSVPDSRLLLCGGDTASAPVRARVREYFSIAGVADRILLPLSDEHDDSGPSTPLDENQEDENGSTLEKTLAALAPVRPQQLREVDIFLDTFPVCCRSELVQALWTGIPCVSLRGTRRPGLVGTSILGAAGRVNWTAADKSEFAAICSYLASDLDALEAERESLRNNIAETPLFNPAETASNVRDLFDRLARQARST